MCTNYPSIQPSGVEMRLEFVVVIGIVLLMHSIYWAGAKAGSGGENTEQAGYKDIAFLAPLTTVISSIPTFIVVGLLYLLLY